jgi:hypothetical protein
MKPSFGFRLDESLVLKSRTFGLNLAALFEEAMSEAIQEKKCTICGSKIRTKRGKRKTRHSSSKV